MLIIISFSCKKGTNPNKGCSSYTGITETNLQGVVIGNIDNTDWRDSGTLQGLLAFPNPTNEECSITFSISTSASLTLTVKDNPEHLVRTLLDDTLQAGIYAVIWDLKDDAGDDVASCIYRLYFNGKSSNGDNLMSFGDIQVQK